MKWATYILSYLMVVSCAQKPGDSEAKVFDITPDNFQQIVLESNNLVLMDFTAEWCMPCKELDPILDKVAPRYSNRLTIAKIDVETNPGIVEEYVPDNIFPCLVMLYKGEVLETRFGADPEMELEPFFIQWIDGHLRTINQ